MKREIKIGIVMIMGVGMLIYGLFFLKGIDVFSDQRFYYVEYNQIGGLAESSAVKVNGLKMGQVTEITIKQDTTLTILVKIIIQNDDLKVPSDSRAIIVTDFLGTGSIDLKLGKNYAEPALTGDFLNGEVSKDLKEQVDEQIAPLKRKIEGLIGTIDSAVQVVQVILNPRTQQNLNESFESVRRALLNMERTSFRLDTLVASERHKISAIMTNIQSISGNMAENNERLNHIIANFESISDSLAKADIAATINSAKNTLDDVSEIMDKINNGEGTMGMLLNNDSLYVNLENSTRAMNILIEDLYQHPERYMHFSVFGRKPRPPKPQFDRKDEEKIRDLIDKN